MTWTPTLAMLWETWRLSRRRIGILMAVTTLGGAALLALPVSRAESATFVLFLMVFAAWIGQVWAVAIDARRGFTLALGFSRPIATWQLVTVPLAFVALSSAATYLVPAVVLSGALEIPFPLLPMAALSATVTVAWVSAQWMTGDPTVRRVTGLSFYLIIFLWTLGNQPSRNDIFLSHWSQRYSFSAEAYAWMVLVSAAALAVAVAGVARQRRGDDQMPLRWLETVRAGARTGRGPAAWLGDRIGLRCPVSSPTMAQLWFEFYTVGGRIVRSGVVMALLLAVVFLSFGNVTGAREKLVSFMMMGMAIPVFAAVPSLLGLHRRQGHVSLGVFAASRALATARLVALKVLVGSLALLVAWVAVATSLSIHVRWNAGSEAILPEILADYLPSSPGGAVGVLLTVIVAIQLAAAVAGAAALHAFLVLNAKRVLLSALGIVLYVASIVVMAVRGWIDGELIFKVHLGVVAATFVLGTLFVLWRGRTERIFSARGFAVVVATGLGFAMATGRVFSEWLNPGGNGVEEWVAGFLIGLLPLATTALAPWSFSRLRHR